MKTFTLDLKNWRCGNDDNYRYGFGDTLLENTDGYMCCLGQFGKQIEDVDMVYLCQPSECKFTKNNVLVKKEKRMYEDTSLSSDCIDINDDEISVSERIQKLKKRLEKENIKLVVKNDKLFDSKGRFIGAHLIKNELGPKINRWPFLEIKNGLPIDLSTLEYTRKLIRTVGKVKTREIIKKYVGNLEDYNEDQD